MGFKLHCGQASVGPAVRPGGQDSVRGALLAPGVQLAGVKPIDKAGYSKADKNGACHSQQLVGLER